MRILQQHNSKYGISISLLVGLLAVTTLIGASRPRKSSRELKCMTGRISLQVKLSVVRTLGCGCPRTKRPRHHKGLTDGQLGPFPSTAQSAYLPTNGDNPPRILDYLMILSKNKSCLPIIHAFLCRFVLPWQDFPPLTCIWH